MTDKEAAALLQAAGHPPDGIERRANGNFYAHCSCGYVSAKRQTQALAVEALIHHMRLEAKKLVANGAALPVNAGAR